MGADDLAEFGEEGGVHCGYEKDSTLREEWKTEWAGLADMFTIS